MSADDHMAELAGKKAFEQTLRRVFKTAKLKGFNDRPNVRLPAAIILDLMDKTRHHLVSSEERVFIFDEVLINEDFVSLLAQAFQKLQADTRLGAFSIAKYPHMSTDNILYYLTEGNKSLDFMYSGSAIAA